MTRLWCVVVLSMVLGTAETAKAEGKDIWITFPNRVVGQTRRSGNILVVVHYKEDPENRKIVLQWDPDDEEGMAGSSEENLTDLNDGIPVVRDLDLPEGLYVFTAILERRDGSEKRTKETMFVIR